MISTPYRLCLMACVAAMSATLTVHAQLSLPGLDASLRSAMADMQAGNHSLGYDAFTRIVRQGADRLARDEAEYRSAECLHQLGRFVDAGDAFERFVERHPASTHADDALFGEGMVRFRQGDHTKAFDCFSRVVNNNEHGNVAPDAAFWAGEAALLMDDLSRAKRYFTICFEVFPQGRYAGEARFSIGLLAEKRGLYEDALDLYRTFLSLHPAHRLVPFANTRIAACLFHLGRFRAVIDLVDSLQDSPDPMNAAERLGFHSESHFRLGRFNDAERYYQSFITAYPEHPLARSIRLSLGRTQLELKKYSEAAGIFDSLSRGEDAIARSALYHLGLTHRLSGRRDKAREVLTLLVERFPTGEFADHAAFDLAVAAFDDGDLTASERHLTRCLGNFPTSRILPFARMLLGETLFLSRDAMASGTMFLSVAEDTAASDDLRRSARLSAGYTRFMAGQYPAAESQFRAFIDSHPDDSRAVVARLWLGECARTTGNHRAARRQFQSLMGTEHPTAIRIAAAWGDAACSQALGLYRESCERLESLRSDFRGRVNEVEVTFRIAELHQTLRNHELASAQYRLAADASATAEDLIYGTLQSSYCLFLAGSASTAISALRSGMAKYPSLATNEKIQYGLGWMLHSIGDHVGARTVFLEAIRNQRCGTLCWDFLAAAAASDLALGNTEDALSGFTLAADSGRTAGCVLASLAGQAQCHILRGDAEAAQSVTTVWIDHHASSPVLSDVMYAEAQRGLEEQDFAGVNRLVDRWRKLDIQHPLRQDFALTQARALKALGRTDEALTMLERGSTMNPASPTALTCDIVRAEIAYEGQDRRSALDQCTSMLESLRFKDRKAEILLLRGRIHATNRQTDSALADFASSSQADPGGRFDFLARIETARMKAQTGDPQSATAELLAIAHERQDAIGASALALAVEVLYKSCSFDEADKVCTRAVRELQEHPQALRRVMLIQGRLFEQRENPSKAGSVYQSIITRFPGSPEAFEAQSRIKDL